MKTVRKNFRSKMLSVLFYKTNNNLNFIAEKLLKPKNEKVYFFKVFLY